jgi:SAM-dependent methyltransferase
MERGFVFDQPHYRAMNEARGEALRQFLLSLEKELTLRSAVDVGCGLGYFSELLRGFRLDVLGLDGRAENIEEAKARVPDAEFHVADAEDSRICSFGKFDLALCFGCSITLKTPSLRFAISLHSPERSPLWKECASPAASRFWESEKKGPPRIRACATSLSTLQKMPS